MYKETRNPGLHLVGSRKSDRQGRATAVGYRTGETIPTSGDYEVIHTAHRLPTEVTLLEGERFPRCAECDGAVEFNLVQSSPGLGKTMRIVVHALAPEMDAYEGEQPASLAG